MGFLVPRKGFWSPDYNFQWKSGAILVSTHATLPTSLIAYWKLGEASGTRADSKGANNLSDTNTVTQAAGKIGNAAQFTRANNENLALADNADMSINGSNFSFSCWVYLDSKPTGGIMGIVARIDNAATQREYDLVYRTSTDRFEFIVWNGTNSSTEVDATNFGSPSLATWYFVHVYYNNTNNEIGISVNNGTVNTATTTITVPDTSANFRIGNRQYDVDSDAPWNGRIDEVGFWKKQLTAAEVTDLYNNGTGIAYD